MRSIHLNGTEFPIVGRPAKKKITPFPPQFAGGELSARDYTPVRSQVWGPLKGGGGCEKWEPGKDDRYWLADDVDCSRNMITPSPLVSTVGTSTAYAGWE